MNRIRALVVDDEPLPRQRISSLLAQEPDVDVIGECETGEDAIRAILEERPDVVFLDVQMPDLDGFGVLQVVGPRLMPDVVFITAFDDYAVRAFEANAVDYLLKPFENARFRETVDRVRGRMGHGDPHRAVATLAEKLVPATFPSRIVVRGDNRYRILSVHDIDWIEVEDTYLRVHAGRETYLWRGSLAALQRLLDPAQFLRVHRSRLVNIDRIRHIEPWNQTEFLVTLENGATVQTSRAYRPRIRAFLEGDGTA